MHGRLLNLAVLAATAFGVFIASDARAASPTLSAFDRTEAVFFSGSGYTIGGDVWVGLSQGGTQKYIWHTNGMSDTTINVFESPVACGQNYQTWAIDWASNQGVNGPDVFVSCLH